MLFEYQSPNKMFEFVALGKPVIASDQKTFRQHFNEREILYFKAGDAENLKRAIKEAFYQPESMKVRAAKALLRYEGYRWGNMKQRYLQLYDKLRAVTR